MQTLPEHDALSWRQGGEADGTVYLCGVGDKVLIVRRQQIQVVSLSFFLLSLHQSKWGDVNPSTETHYKLSQLMAETEES